jgi:hypothetical protein
LTRNSSAPLIRKNAAVAGVAVCFFVAIADVLPDNPRGL